MLIIEYHRVKNFRKTKPLIKRFTEVRTEPYKNNLKRRRKSDFLIVKTIRIKRVSQFTFITTNRVVL